MEPNKENIRKWVEKLRDPNTKQGRFQLGHRSGERCCLGVACDVAVENGVIAPPIFDEPANMVRWGGEGSTLPSAVAEWLGLGTMPSLHLNSKTALFGEIKSSDSLINLNDNDQLTFPQIADLLEYEFLSGKEEEE